MSATTAVVHGQYPVRGRKRPQWMAKLGFPGAPDTISNDPITQKYSLARVPGSFTVRPLQESGTSQLQLSSNYSILKPVAALIQVIYGSFEIYRASRQQLGKFGYAAYSLSVIPYIIMSVVNLLASMCEPQYPSMFLVYYRGVERGSTDGKVKDSPDMLAQLPGVEQHIISKDKDSPDILERLPAVEQHVVGEVRDPHDIRAQLPGVEQHVVGAVGVAYGEVSKSPEEPGEEPRPTERLGFSGLHRLGRSELPDLLLHLGPHEVTFLTALLSEHY